MGAVDKIAFHIMTVEKMNGHRSRDRHVDCSRIHLVITASRTGIHDILHLHKTIARQKEVLLNGRLVYLAAKITRPGSEGLVTNNVATP